MKVSKYIVYFFLISHDISNFPEKPPCQCVSPWAAGPCEVCLSKITSDKNADDFESKTKDYGCLKMSRQVTRQFLKLCIMVINHLENVVVISPLKKIVQRKHF